MWKLSSANSPSYIEKPYLLFSIKLKVGQIKWIFVLTEVLSQVATLDVHAVHDSVEVDAFVAVLLADSNFLFVDLLETLAKLSEILTGLWTILIKELYYDILGLLHST